MIGWLMNILHRTPAPPAPQSSETSDTITHLRAQRDESLAEVQRLRRLDIAEFLASARPQRIFTKGIR